LDLLNHPRIKSQRKSK